jgi:hypothetical protein
MNMRWSRCVNQLSRPGGQAQTAQYVWLALYQRTYACGVPISICYFSERLELILACMERPVKKLANNNYTCSR